MSEGNEYSFEELNEVSLEDGIRIDGELVKGIQEIDIKSNESNVSQVTIKFFCKVKGLDDLSTKQ